MTTTIPLLSPGDSTNSRCLGLYIERPLTHIVAVLTVDQTSNTRVTKIEEFNAPEEANRRLTLILILIVNPNPNSKPKPNTKPYP